MKPTSLSKNWELPEQWKEYTLSLGLSNKQIDIMEKRFKDYYLSNQSLNMNWQLVWDDWVMRMTILGGIKRNI